MESWLWQGFVNMEEKYGIVEYTDIHIIYGRANGNALEAVRLYAEAFPNRRHPNNRTFTRIHQRLWENGSFRHQDDHVEERVLERVDVNSGTSTRRVAMQEGISASSVWRIFHHQLLYPYHIQRVQGLKNVDFLPRLTFCQQKQQQSALDRQFLTLIVPRAWEIAYTQPCIKCQGKSATNFVYFRSRKTLPYTHLESTSYIPQQGQRLHIWTTFLSTTGCYKNEYTIQFLWIACMSRFATAILSSETELVLDTIRVKQCFVYRRSWVYPRRHF